MLPTPVLPGLAVVDHIGPGISNFLPVVSFVAHFQWHSLVYRSRELLDCEADGCHIVAGSDFDLARIGLHELDGATDGIIHKNHGNGGFGVDETLISCVLECAMEDGDGVVSSAAARQLFPADNAGIPQAAHV